MKEYSKINCSNYNNNYNNNVSTSPNTYSNDSEPISGAVEIKILLKDGSSELLKLNLDENIFSKIDFYCLQKGFSPNEKKLIIDQINQKISNLISELEIKDYNKMPNFIKKQISKSPIIIHKKNKFCISNGDLLGQKLYEREMFHKEKNENRRKKLLEEKIRDNNVENIFKPKILKKSIDISKNMNRNLKIEDRLIKLGKIKDSKINRKISENNS